MALLGPSLLPKYKLIEKSLRDSRLGNSVTPSAVLQILIEHDGPNGCFPGKSRIAKLCGKDRSNVDDALKRLRENGYIDWDKSWDDRRGCWRTNRYTINYSADKPDNPLPEHEEEQAIEELVHCIKEHLSSDYQTASTIAEHIRASLWQTSSKETMGPVLWKLVRDVQRNSPDNNMLDCLIRNAQSEMNLKEKKRKGPSASRSEDDGGVN